MPSAKEIKEARKTIRFIEENFGTLSTPYKIIFDAEMLATITMRKIPWKKQLEELLQGKPFVPMVTEETVQFLRSYGDRFIETVVMAKNMSRPRKSKIVEQRQQKGKRGRKGKGRHSNKMDDVYRSIFECIGRNSDRGYFLATNDVKLREHISRAHPMVPIIRIVSSGLRFQKPTEGAKKNAAELARKKVGEYSQLSPWERKMLMELQQKSKKEDASADDDNKVEKEIGGDKDNHDDDSSSDNGDDDSSEDEQSSDHDSSSYSESSDTEDVPARKKQRRS